MRYLLRGYTEQALTCVASTKHSPQLTFRKALFCIVTVQSLQVAANVGEDSFLRINLTNTRGRVMSDQRVGKIDSYKVMLTNICSGLRFTKLSHKSGSSNASL